MQQFSLFDSDTAPDVGAMPVLAVTGSARKLSKAQRRFNKLVEKLTAQRQELAQWQAFRQAHQQQLAADYWPLAARVRDRRGALARLLDRAMDSKLLVKRERTKMRSILIQLLSTLLEEGKDPELIELYDKYADVSFGEEQQSDLDFLRAVATEDFGVDLDDYHGGDSPEELSAWLAAQVNAESPEPRPGRQDPRTMAQEVLREKAAEGGARAVREVFRKLVSELHPDRETDPAEHARKTEIMQRVNQAYEAGDLLALLEVQISIEQTNPASLSSLADDRLRHYIRVFEEQSQGLRDQLSEILAPFVAAVGASGRGLISPESVSRSLAADIRELKRLLRSIDQDYETFQDIRQLKRVLREYRVDRTDHA